MPEKTYIEIESDSNDDEIIEPKQVTLTQMKDPSLPNKSSPYLVKRTKQDKNVIHKPTKKPRASQTTLTQIYNKEVPVLKPGTFPLVYVW